MPCPTCDKTFECVSRNEDMATFQCPICGTVMIKDYRNKQEAVYVPALVERCREFEAAFNPQLHTPAWHTLGIAESINLPADRPAPEKGQVPK